MIRLLTVVSIWLLTAWFWFRFRTSASFRFQFRLDRYKRFSRLRDGRMK